MFQRAGGNSSQKKKDQNGSATAQALSQAATAITCALTSSPAAKGAPGPVVSTSSSPAKMIDSRAKLYKQLSELQNLKSMGILTETEYATEKQSWIR